ncbi:hypothetical protein NDK47_02850 [Brevibacillus ruminantium]|uniref:Uncharacterized protein n=1 Tax=Brevibacillus ruminantium TaxID=2950604 RepID=A0ABY4WGX4_9BACL|nr:hypothetical protein [Brevibacillus ruminantium]USG66288.1 hypothetical protein NDK47_02850 [Brevibacillus ruminantium]
MWQKRCLDCQKRSYSSQEWYEWLCPYCGKNLTLLRATPASVHFVPIRLVPPCPQHPSGEKAPEGKRISL